MLTGRHSHSLYCWALPTIWGPRHYGRFYFPPSPRQSLRSKRSYAVRASISTDSTRESEDAYRQFANMLGEDSPSQPQTVDTRSAAYADFADMLGLNHNDREDDKEKSVAKLSPKKVEIDPEDYNIFDKMLEQTGGKGRKPVKGAKPYSRYIAMEPRKGTKRRSGKREAPQSHVNDLDKPQNDINSQTPAGVFLTDEEKAQAYAVMMEEFGPGVHDGVETWTPDENVEDLEPQSPRLLKPPERPGAPQLAEPTSQAIYDAPSNDLEAQQDAEDDVESLILLPKPSIPVANRLPSSQETTKPVPSESGKNDSDRVPFEGSLTASSQLGIEAASGQESQERGGLHDKRGTHNFSTSEDDITPELVPPPIRPAQERVLSGPQIPVEESQTTTWAPLALNDAQSSEQHMPSILPKPQRQLESRAVSAVENTPLELITHSAQRKQFYRTQKLRKEEPPEVLRNPKLVYQVE